MPYEVLKQLSVQQTHDSDWDHVKRKGPIDHTAQLSKPTTERYEFDK